MSYQGTDETAQEIEQAAAELQAASRDLRAQAQRTPGPVLALGAGAILGGLLAQGKVMGILGGAAAGYFLHRAVQR